MSLIIGLVFLTVGNFLGGVWANESWGRYWGWDPKETWALSDDFGVCRRNPLADDQRGV